MKKQLHLVDGNSPVKSKPITPFSHPGWRKFSLVICSIFLMLISLNAAAQTKTVSGTVKDETGQTVPGVTVVVKGTSMGIVTNANGHYSLNVPNGSNTLVFSIVGYVKQEVRIDNQTVINIALAPDNKNLNEVVVIGYGVQNRRDVTGSVSTIKANDLNKTNAVSVDNLIQGKAAGVSVNTYTSQPGGDVNVTIRGALSPNGSNAPLYVIDGLPLTSQASESVPTPGGFRGNINRSPLAGINPDDIESVDILKDASATAIYGSAAANGVILITTKKGKDGATTVNYNGTHSLQRLKQYLQPLNATQFENAVNSYGEEYWKVNNKVAPYGSVNPTTVTPYSPYFTQAQIAAAGEGTNYIDYVLRNGHVDDQNISVTGGNANTKVFTSFNFFNQQGLIKNSGFKRYAGRINVDQKIGSNVNFSLGLSYSQVNNDNVPVGNSSDLDSPSLLQTALQFAPSIPLYNDKGLPSSSYYTRTPNPASYLAITNQTFTKRLLVTPNLQINILDGLKLNIAGGIDNNSSDNQFYIPVRANFNTVPYGDAERSLTKTNNYSTEAYLTYNKTVNKSRFSAVAGLGYYASNQNGFGLDAVGFSTDAFGVDNIGIANQKALSGFNSFKTARTKLSQFTRLNYTYNDKYILQVTGRFDGTSNFPQNHLFGFFPGISGGWLINQENFLKDVKWLSQLKLRGGFGTSGNESITAGNNYVYSLYKLTNDFGYLLGNQYYNSGFIQTQLGNPDLKWETDQQIDAAVDFGFFNNRISGSVDYFNRTAKNLLDFRVLPSENAITTQAFNVGSTRSKGVELTLRTENFVGKTFSWATTFTFATAKSYWVQRNPAVSLAPYVGAHDPIHAVYGWKADGLIRSAAEIPSYQTGAYVGNTKYVDANGDGKLDIGDVSFLANTDPKATFGLNNTFKFKDFDLNFFFYGSYGYLAFDGYQQFAQAGKLTRPGAPGNGDIHSLDIYTSFNPNGRYPGFAPDPAAANNPTGVNNYLAVQNGYFVRLKDVTLGYSLPKGLVASQKFIRSARIFIDMQNLFYITNTKGIDPEMSRNNNPYPVASTTAFGLSAQF
jgi:TonB-linked SusC/RagA family outer membrane protein